MCVHEREEEFPLPGNCVQILSHRFQFSDESNNIGVTVWQLIYRLNRLPRLLSLIFCALRIVSCGWGEVEDGEESVLSGKRYLCSFDSNPELYWHDWAIKPFGQSLDYDEDDDESMNGKHGRTTAKDNKIVIWRNRIILPGVVSFLFRGGIDPRLMNG